MSKPTLTQEEFINQAKEAHGEQYDYSECIYVSQRKKVKIICRLHGIFEQTPGNHTHGGYGCWKCRKPRRGVSFDEFLLRAARVHNGKQYSYDPSTYKDVSSKVGVTCPLHGSFLQRGSDHLQGKGCRACMAQKFRDAYISNTAEFINKARDIFADRYGYQEAYYQGNKVDITIVCEKHGRFNMTPNNHLRGHGCPRCANTPISAISQRWLDSIGIPDEYREKKLNIKEQIIIVDAYDPETNTVFEFWGDFWHGNPQKFDSNDENYRNKKTFGDLYERTLERRRLIMEAGYNLAEIWESDFRR